MPVSEIATSTNLIDAPAGTNPNGILDKDDFLKLLLVELQYQDPTSPTDADKILSQTSQLASLESSDNTNKSLAELSATLKNTSQFNAISTIGKLGDLGSRSVLVKEGDADDLTFSLFFEEEIDSGVIEITDNEGSVIKSYSLQKDPDNPDTKFLLKGSNGELLETYNIKANGVYNFDWNKLANDNSSVDAGEYNISATYKNPDGDEHVSRLGTYPIESVRFEEGFALVKLGDAYVPLTALKEIYAR